MAEKKIETLCHTTHYSGTEMKNILLTIPFLHIDNTHLWYSLKFTPIKLLRVRDTAYPSISKSEFWNQNHIRNSCCTERAANSTCLNAEVKNISSADEFNCTWYRLNTLLLKPLHLKHHHHLCEHLHSWFLSEHIHGHIFRILQALRTKIDCLVSLTLGSNKVSARALHQNGVKLLFEPQHFREVKVVRSKVYSCNYFIAAAFSLRVKADKRNPQKKLGWLRVWHVTMWPDTSAQRGYSSPGDVTY